MATMLKGNSTLTKVKKEFPKLAYHYHELKYLNIMIPFLCRRGYWVSPQAKFPVFISNYVGLLHINCSTVELTHFQKELANWKLVELKNA